MDSNDFDLIGIDTDLPPVPFRWDLLNDADHLTYSEDLARFVDWLVARYRLHRAIPPCWWHHGAHVEELSATFVAWRSVMEAANTDPFSWGQWHDALGRMLGRFRELWPTGCTADHHDVETTSVDRARPVEWLGVG